MAETLALVPVFTGTLNAQSVQLCDARTLHAFMGVLRDFSDWIKGRIRKFKFVEGVDYLLAKTGEKVFPKSGENLGGRPSIDYHLTLDMAKELAMVENNDKGREARRYFIACEKQAMAQPTLAPYSVHPGQSLSEDQAQTLRSMLDEFVKTLPKEKQGGFMVKGWAKLKAHFNVGYREIPADKFTDAVSILARHIVEHSTPELPAPEQPKQDSMDFSYLSLKNKRLLLSYDHNGKELIQRVPNDAMLVTWHEVAQILREHHLMISLPQITEIINAGCDAIVKRMQGKMIAA